MRSRVPRAFSLKSPQKLVGQRDGEPMLTPIGIMAFMIHCGFVAEVGSTSGNKCSALACGSPCVDMNIDRWPLAFLTRPAVDVVVVAGVVDTVNDARHWAGTGILGSTGEASEQHEQHASRHGRTAQVSEESHPTPF